MLDRIFDNYVMGPMQKIVLNHLRPEADRDPYGVSEARALLDRPTPGSMGTCPPATGPPGKPFSLADCAAAPSLFFADWAHEIARNHSDCGPTAPACWLTRPFAVPCTRHSRIAATFRWARRIATDVGGNLRSAIAHE